MHPETIMDEKECEIIRMARGDSMIKITIDNMEK